MQEPSSIHYEMGVTTFGRIGFEWFDPPFEPPEDDVDQVYGLCITDEGSIVLVHDGSYGWNLPGGGAEPGETLREAFEREVREEACARVLDARYIGCQRVTHLDREHVPRSRSGLHPYWQVRFWARVALDVWEPQHEIVERRLVQPDEFLSTLKWGIAPTAERILTNALAVERLIAG